MQIALKAVILSVFVVVPGVVGVSSANAADPQGADLVVQVNAPQSIADGSAFEEVVGVTNDGPSVAIDVVVAANTLTIGNTGVAAYGGTQADGVHTWHNGNLASGDTVYDILVYAILANYHSTAVLGGVAIGETHDPNPTNNAAIALLQIG